MTDQDDPFLAELEDKRAIVRQLMRCYAPGSLEQIIAHILEKRGESGRCRSCGDSIVWIKSAEGKAAPYNADGRIHFITCPNAGQHRKS